MAATTAPQLQLSYQSELDEVSATSERSFSVMASIRAGQSSATRAPVCICAVLDRSGSMSGPKLELVKKSMSFMTQNLNSTDQLSIVTFDHTVKVELPMTKMTPEGQQLAVQRIQQITVNGSTNLSGGLFTGLQQIQAAMQSVASSSSSKPVVSVVWLFTDGLANAGITDGPTLKRETEARLKQLPFSCSIFTFGFGADHNATMLRDVANVGSGMYNYIEQEHQIADAFSNCLGGVLSVAAQNLRLTARVANPTAAKIVKAQTGYKSDLILNGATVDMPDIYTEESRDVIFQVRVPKHDPYSEPRPLLHITLQYFNVLTCNAEEFQVTCNLARPATAKPPKPVSVELDRQRNRVRATEAMARAFPLVERKEYQEARVVLMLAMDAIDESATGKEEFSLALLEDLQECLDNIGAPDGIQIMTSYEESHGKQRSSHKTKDLYSTSLKNALMVAARQQIP